MNNAKTLTEVRVSLSNDMINIPYAPVEDSDREVFPYRNLIKHSDEIDSIPELKDEPFMKKCIARINSPEGLFETFRINHWFDHNETGSRQVMCLGFFFRDRRLFHQYSNCMMVLGNLMQRMEADGISLPQSPLMEIQRAHLKTEKINGWVIDLYMSGYGHNEQFAREDLGTTLVKFDSFFLTGT